MKKLKSQNHACEQADKHHDRGRPGSNEIDLVNNDWELPGMKDHQKCPEKEEHHGAEFVDPAYRDPSQEVHGGFKKRLFVHQFRFRTETFSHAIVELFCIISNLRIASSRV